MTDGNGTAARLDHAEDEINRLRDRTHDLATHAQNALLASRLAEEKAAAAHSRIKRVEDDVKGLATRDQVDGLKAQMDKLVTREAFTPVRLIIYGAAAMVLSGFVASLVALAWKAGNS